MSGLKILSVAPSATVQDRGRIGWLRYGVTSGGAMDAYALAEGQTLLGNGPDDAALEFAEFGGRFQALGPVMIATSGARMDLLLNGAVVDWRRSVQMRAGDVLDIGAAHEGVYGYLHISGGFQTELVLGARSTHLRAGFGHVLQIGQTLIAGNDRTTAPLGLPVPDYFSRRVIRALWGPQSHYFSASVRQAFAGATLAVTKMRDRMGIQVRPSGDAIVSDAGLTIASDAINLGDIQVTGDGTPAILLADRGSSGGYPRIATVITADIGVLAQLPTGARFHLEMIEREAAVAALGQFRASVAALKAKAKPVLRDPRDMADLLAYNLIDGMLRGDEYDHD